MKKLLTLAFVSFTLFCSFNSSFAGNCGSCMQKTGTIIDTYLAPAVVIEGQLMQEITAQKWLNILDALREHFPRALAALYQACKRRTGLDIETQGDIVTILFAARFVDFDGTITAQKAIPLILKAVTLIDATVPTLHVLKYSEFITLPEVIWLDNVLFETRIAI